jgi:hypothetical protein
MNPFDDCSMRDEAFGATLPPMAGNIELIDSDDASVDETEIPDDPNRWTLPEIREASAVAIFVCMAPALTACVAAAALSAWAAFEHAGDECDPSL